VKTIARRVGRYDIERVIGSGGMATVYLARHVDLDREVALKELALFDRADPRIARRFLHEARLAGSLSHPNIVTVHDYLEHEGRPYIAMEYMPRGSLRPYVGQMSLAQVGGVLAGVLGGLALAEEHGVVHRDLKPENIMVSAQGWVKIADFGIAKATSETQTIANLTTAGTTLGTPRYMAPERAMGQEVGPWSDLYSVGVMVFEMLVGHAPFHDTEEPLAVLMKQINEPIPPVRSLVPDVDAAISSWIDRLLEKDPAARTRSATTAWDELDEILAELLGGSWTRAAGLPASPGGPTTSLPSIPGPAPAPPSPAQPQAPVSGILWRARTRTTVALDERAELAATEPPLTIPFSREHAQARERPRRSRTVARAALVAAGVIAAVAAATAGRGGPTEQTRPAAPARARTDALVALQLATRSHRPQLAAARTQAARRRASETLASDYDRAARRVDDPQLVAALQAAARQYLAAAGAAQRGDAGGYRAAQARVDEREAAVERILAGPSADSPPDDSGIGDSRSDDPSDDEPDDGEP
jgi:serine/threonine protein kinase